MTKEWDKLTAKTTANSGENRVYGQCGDLTRSEYSEYDLGIRERSGKHGGYSFMCLSLQ